MTDRELLTELCHDLTNRWMRAEQEGYGNQREPEKMQEAALRRLLDSVERMVAAEKRWDFEKWNDAGPAKHAAAVELSDAMAALRKTVAP